jgi:undecaprenyl-phosphate 4-deoxy-4-formamido-L-arabinose transferase
MRYSIVIPVYNGEKTVKNLFERIKLFFNNRDSYEVIFVYDCGKDNSWKVLVELKEKYHNEIKLIKLSRNFGQHNALICGFEYATGDFVITMDEDLQHAPEDIEKLIYQQQKGDFDVVYGKYETRQHSGIRNLGSSVLKKIIDIGVPDIHPDYSAFRLLKVSVAKSLIGMRNSYTFLDGYLSWITSNCSSCVVSHSERQGGVSAYTFQKLVNHTINIFVTFSNLPIRLLTTLSFVVLTFMSLYSAYVLIRKLIFNDLALGYSSLIIIIGFGVGIIMLALGIIGEYIYRINLKTTKRPNYNVNEVL